MKTPRQRSAKNTRFRPGTAGLCEAQLWAFTGPKGMLLEKNAPQMHWVAAESLEAALQYMRQRYDLRIRCTQRSLMGRSNGQLFMTQ
jgi:hypothetical protein